MLSGRLTEASENRLRQAARWSPSMDHDQQSVLNQGQRLEPVLRSYIKEVGQSGIYIPKDGMMEAIKVIAKQLRPRVLHDFEITGSAPQNRSAGSEIKIADTVYTLQTELVTKSRREVRGQVYTKYQAMLENSIRCVQADEDGQMVHSIAPTRQGAAAAG